MDHQYAKTKCKNPKSFKKCNVQKLQGYLKERGVTYNKCNKKVSYSLLIAHKKGATFLCDKS